MGRSLSSTDYASSWERVLNGVISIDYHRDGKLGNSSTPVNVVRDTTVISTTYVESYGLYEARGNVGIVTRERRQMASLAHWINVQRARDGRFWLCRARRCELLRAAPRRARVRS